MSAAHGRAVVVMHIAFLERMARHVDANPIFMTESIALRAFLAEHDANAKDAARLDWVIDEVMQDTIIGGIDIHALAALRVPADERDDELAWVNAVKDAARVAIDRAISGVHHPDHGDTG